MLTRTQERTCTRSRTSGLALALALALAACGGAAAPGVGGVEEIPFEDHGATQRSDHEGPEPNVVLDQEAVATVPGATVAPGRLAIAVLQGQQRTGGYGIEVRRVVRTGTTLQIRASFAAPAADAIVIQVLTSPAQLISVERADVSGVTRVVLVDDGGAERASTTASLR